ncbi:MAG: hypothetical protein ACREQ9_02330 [Candidatus Binatia bacterium]
MAKRLAVSALVNESTEDGAGAIPGSCRVCGGPVAVEDLQRGERYPRRLKCLRCDAEYGTTRPAVRNY